MTPLVHRTSMFLLLLMCGRALHEASAASSCPLMDIVTLLSGNFYLSDGGIWINITYLPLDNPALNQYKPFYYKETWNDVIFSEGISLFGEGSSVSYSLYFYFIDNLAQYGPPESYLSTVTRDDLAGHLNCTENGLLNEDKMESTLDCYFKDVHALLQSERTCSDWSTITTVVGPSPYEAAEPEYLRLSKLSRYPLPASWLEGHEDYVSLCSA